MNASKFIFFSLALGSLFVSPAVALFVGIVFAFVFRHPYANQSARSSKYLLQISVVGLGFGMNIEDSVRSSSEGMLMTIVSVVGVLTLGYFIARWMGVDRKLGYLISSGTAICGGSAIAAIAPVVRADANQTSMSLAVIFTLNAVALFVFPTIGSWFNMSENQFGMWAAIAIHDTSSVVGAAQDYGPEALIVATTIKLTRALWIIPLALVSTLFFPAVDGTHCRISIPWFIFLFVLAMVVNTYLSINSTLLEWISIASHKSLGLTLFLIGSSLRVEAIRKVGARPVVMAILLWIAISVVSLFVILC